MDIITKVFFITFFIVLNSFCQSFLNNDFDISRKDFFIKLRDGVQLDCTSIYPEIEKPTYGFPCIVFCHGFGKSKEDNLLNAKIYSRYGFATFIYSMRGQGNSEGESNLISRIEAMDLNEIIEYIKSDTMIDINRIAISGSSQGGIIPLMASCYGLDVQCIISDLISPDFASNWIDNGCIKMSLLWSLSYPDSIVRYNKEVKYFRNWILSKRKDLWDSLIYYLPLNRDFSKDIAKINIPIFISNSFQDKYFNANCLIINLYKFDYKTKFYFGSIEGHGSLFSENEIDLHNLSINNWIDKWLNNINSSYDKKYTVSLSSLPLIDGIWFYNRMSSDSSFFEKPNRIKFYFHPKKIISEQPYKRDIKSFKFNNIVNDSTFNINDAINTEFNGYHFNSNFKKVNLVFESEPLQWNYNALGIPKLHLVYKSNKTECQFNFQIYEVFKNGSSKFISSINYTDRNCNKNKIKVVNIDGDALGHIFSVKSRIKIILTNLDTRENDLFLRTNPYVLPVFTSSKNTIYIGGSEGSYIEIPLKE